MLILYNKSQEISIKFEEFVNNKLVKGEMIMELLWEIVQFAFYSGLIVLISKYILVRTLRSLAENLNLKPKTVGDVAGVATSVPELLTIGAASINGLLGASIYNVLSSNVINLIQYSGAIALNKNQNAIRNKAIKIDIVLVLITIIIPIFFSILKSEFQLAMVPVFIILYWGFKKINNNVHKLYLPIDEDVEDSATQKNSNKFRLFRDIVILIITGILLFLIGDWLGNTLEVLCGRFNVPELVVGIVLGFITSIPELITFFEAQRHHKKAENEMLGVVEATNNLLMSNMMNLFVIQSIGILLFQFFGS